MKKIDSIDYGGKVIGIGFICAIVIPVCLKLLNLFFACQFLDLLAWCFGILGGIILVGFIIYLGIELRQDKKISHYYDTHRNLKIPIDDRYYECANCGNRKVKKEDVSCQICGVKFSGTKDRSVQEILGGK